VPWDVLDEEVMAVDWEGVLEDLVDALTELHWEQHWASSWGSSGLSLWDHLTWRVMDMFEAIAIWCTPTASPARHTTEQEALTPPGDTPPAAMP